MATKISRSADPAGCRMDSKALFIDGRNALYRAIYAVKRDRRPGSKSHGFTVFLRQLANWVNDFRPQSVHVFWDAPKATVWRRKILPTYKERDPNSYTEDIGADLEKVQQVTQAVLPFLAVRQYSRKYMEADDLLYAGAVVRHPAETVIVSTDSDMLQIPFMLNSVTVYDPQNRVNAEVPPCHPAVQKALVGDTSDKVPGYNGIGPKRSAILLEDHNKLQEFLDTAGRAMFSRNLILIDLSLCPRLLDNQLYVRRMMAKPVVYDKTRVKDLINEYKISGLTAELSNLAFQFKSLS